MLKKFFVSFICFSSVFCFFSDSHIGDTEKTEVDYIKHPALTSFTDTPKEGRVRISFGLNPSKLISKLYDDNGDIEAVNVNESYNVSSNYIALDYYGYKRSGISLVISNSTIDYKSAGLEDEKIPVTFASVYFLWGDKFSFPVQSIKSEFGFADSLGILISQSIDYRITSNQMWSNKFILTTKDTSDELFPESSRNTVTFSSQLIYNLSQSIGASAMFTYYKFDEQAMGASYTTSMNSLELSAGLQLAELGYGYYNFNLRLKPSFKIPLSGRNYFKENIMALGVTLDFI